MKKYLTEEHNLFRESLSEFLEREVRPNIEKWEKDGRIPKSIWKKMGDMGFLGLSYPEKYGGSGLDFFFEIVFNEELGQARTIAFPMIWAALLIYSFSMFRNMRRT